MTQNKTRHPAGIESASFDEVTFRSGEHSRPARGPGAPDAGLGGRGEPNSDRSEPADFDARKGFEAARISMQRGRVDDAMLLIRRVCNADPEQVQYLALHAWLRVQRGELRPGHEAKHILDTLNRAVCERRDDLEIRAYRARVLQRLGRVEEAVRDFSFIVKADPRNVEAAREVRLHRTRSGDAPLRSGVFHKPFSR